MKPLKSSDLRQKKTEELEALRQERRRMVFDARFNHYTGQATDTAAITIGRRDIARIETILSERARAATGG
ncbi:MAG: 50S ribosomal protein L29 [Deltaproteobacteria bacterium]|jgi:large subunit ribosomal protein L29|nr:50S ribosomal protein L29 [Deltaproteobacteria bacterium]